MEVCSPDGPSVIIVYSPNGMLKYRCLASDPDVAVVTNRDGSTFTYRMHPPGMCVRPDPSADEYCVKYNARTPINNALRWSYSARCMQHVEECSKNCWKDSPNGECCCIAVYRVWITPDLFSNDPAATVVNETLAYVGAPAELPDDLKRAFDASFLCDEDAYGQLVKTSVSTLVNSISSIDAEKGRPIGYTEKQLGVGVEHHDTTGTKVRRGLYDPELDEDSDNWTDEHLLQDGIGASTKRECKALAEEQEQYMSSSSSAPPLSLSFTYQSDMHCDDGADLAPMDS